MLQQQNVTVVGSIHLDSRLEIFKPVWPSFDTPTDTISDWLNVDVVWSRRFAATSLLPDGSGNVQSVTLWVLQCSRHIAGKLFIFQQVGSQLINIAWVRLPWFAYNSISHGSVASHLSCGATYNGHCFTNLVPSLTVKEFWKLADISWSYGQDYSGTLLDSRCRTDPKLLGFIHSFIHSFIQKPQLFPEINQQRCSKEHVSAVFNRNHPVNDIILFYRYTSLPAYLIPWKGRSNAT